MNTTEQVSESTGKLESVLRSLVTTVREQGQLWAHHGLNTGKVALQTNAKALSSVADLLGKLAESFDVKDAKKEEAPVAEPDKSVVDESAPSA